MQFCWSHSSKEEEGLDPSLNPQDTVYMGKVPQGEKHWWHWSLQLQPRLSGAGMDAEECRGTGKCGDAGMQGLQRSKRVQGFQNEMRVYAMLGRDTGVQGSAGYR